MSKIKKTNKEKYLTSNLNPYDIYLKKNGLTRYRIFKETGIPQPTLLHVSRKSVADIELRYFIVVARLLHRSVGEVVTEVLTEEMELDSKLVHEYNE